MDICLLIALLLIPFSSFLERGEETEKERQKHQCVVASRAPPAGDVACNPGMCPDWGSNWRPFGLQAGLTPLSHSSQGGAVIKGSQASPRLQAVSSNRTGLHSDSARGTTETFQSTGCKERIPEAPREEQDAAGTGHGSNQTLKPWLQGARRTGSPRGLPASRPLQVSVGCSLLGALRREVTSPEAPPFLRPVFL